MQYVEMLRSRSVLTWFCGLLLGAFVLVVISVYSGHAHMHGSVGTIHFSEVLKGCAFGAMVLATCVAPGLNAESGTLAITWTRPASRSAIAWRYIAVDVVTILVGYAFVVALVLGFLAVYGLLGNLAFDAAAPLALLNAVGCVLMWYGLVTVVTARMDGRGGLISGVSWGVFLALTLLWIAPLPSMLHVLVTVLNYFSPFSYFADSSSRHGGTDTIVPLATQYLTLIAWGFVAVTLTATVRLWSTREV